MENTLIQKIREYLEITKKIDTMESALPTLQKDATMQIGNGYDKLKRELNGFLNKIRPTVETVCGIYRSKVGVSMGKVIFAGESMAIYEYTPQNAPEVSMKLGNEAIKLLSLVVGKNNVETNLREFAKRYNTIVDIYQKTDDLKSKAINQAIGARVNEIAALKLQRTKICFSQNQFNELVKQAQALSGAIAKSVLIGDRLELAKEYTNEVTLPVSYEFCDGKTFGVNGKVYLSQLNWNLKKDGFLVLRKQNQSDGLNELATFTNNIVLQFLFKYPSLSKRILLCDSYSNPEITTFAGSLKDSLPLAFFDGEKRVRNSKEDIKNAFVQLNKVINERIMLLGQSRYESILEYNLHNQDNTQPIILAVLNGYPLRYEEAYDEITSVLKNGQKAGVFFVIVETCELDEDTKYYAKRLPDITTLTRNILTVTKENGNIFLNGDGRKFGWDTRDASYDVKNVLSALKVKKTTDSDKIVYLENVLDKENFMTSKRREEFSRNLSSPIGKEGAAPINIELRADGPTAHMAIIGTTGSGKTAFINSLVLSACNHYSPEELELHMMVMVKGDFTVFKDHKLPHLKTMVAGGENITANDILDFLNEEMARRTVAMKKQDIYVYNKTAKVKMPRCLIIIDEFAELVKESDEAIKQIEKIARVGRSFGISLIVSSPQFPSETNAIKPLFGNRIEFASGENAGQLIEEAYANQSTLTGAKGLCFYSNGGNIHTVKVAYSEEDEKLHNHIAKVRNKYPHNIMKLQSDIETVKVSKEADAPFTVRNAKEAYDEEGAIRTRLGKTFLTAKSVEYVFESTSNVLYIFGQYLKTKELEASLIKDTLILSKDIDKTVAYFIDLNKKLSDKKQSNVMKRLRDEWEMSGKVAYCDNSGVEDIIEEIKDIIDDRKNNDDSDIYPILVVMSKCDEYYKNNEYELTELIDAGKDNNVYFVIEFSEFPSSVSSGTITDAVIFPDKEIEGEESYSSANLCGVFERMPASETERGKALLRKAYDDSLHPKLHLLCVKNKYSVFIPYENDEDYLKDAVK